MSLNQNSTRLYNFEELLNILFVYSQKEKFFFLRFFCLNMHNILNCNREIPIRKKYILETCNKIL